MALSKNAQCIIEAHRKGYRVTDDGRVLSPRGVDRVLTPTSKKQKQYYRISYCMSTGQKRTINVHQLAGYQKFGMLAFGRDENGKRLHVRHLNGDSLDNRLSNIGIGTQKDNEGDKDPAVRKAAAMKAARAQRKLTNDQVRELRKDHASGLSYKKLKEKYNVAISSISYIVNRKMYQEVV